MTAPEPAPEPAPKPAPDPRAEGIAPPTVDSRSSFSDAIVWGVAQALHTDARRLLWVDPDFAAWPLDDPALHTLLTRFLRRPQRRLQCLAAHFDEMPRRHPRFTRWRRDWAHALQPQAAPEAQANRLPTLLLDDRGTVVRLLDRSRWKGRAGTDPLDARGTWHALDALLQQSEPAWPVTLLGT